MIRSLRGTILSIVIVILLALSYHWWWNGLAASWTRALTGSAQKNTWSGLVWLRDRAAYLGQLNQLVETNQALNLEKRQWQEQLARVAELEKENNFLREELAVAKRHNYSLTLAHTLEISLTGPFRTAVIDQGENTGVRPNQPVIFQGNILVGVVKEVYHDSALVYLVNDPRLGLSVKLLDSTVAGKTHGALNQGVALELITNQELVKVGSMVATNGLDGLPSDLVVGSVGGASLANGALFQTISIDPLYPRYLLEQVFVLK